MSIETYETELTPESPVSFVGVSQETIATQREEWIKKLEELQAVLEKLNGDIVRTQQQMAMLSGAVQSCDFFLQNAPASQDA